MQMERILKKYSHPLIHEEMRVLDELYTVLMLMLMNNLILVDEKLK